MKRYSKEFRQAAIERIRNGETQSAVAKDLGISSKTSKLMVVFHQRRSLTQRTVRC